MTTLKLKNTVLWWVPLGLLLALASLLIAAEHELQLRIDNALATERVHVGRARSVWEGAQKTYVAMLERWIRPEPERLDRAKAGGRDLEELRRATEGFASLTPLNRTEAGARSSLIVALALFSNRVQKALINEDGPAAIAEIHETIDAIHRATAQVLTIDSAAGRVTDTQMIALRKKSGAAVLGLVVIGAGACVHAFIWWLQKRRADHRWQTAESARREQEQAAEVRARFYAHLSHELRTPLITIQNLTTELDHPQDLSTAKQIRQAADELLHGINNVLDSSKLETAPQSLRLESVDIGQVLRRSVHRCEGLIGIKDIELVVRLGENLPSIVGDSVKLHQIFTNLVANAVKFTERGRVEIEARRQDNHLLRVEVSDTGIGISEQAMSHIWQPFQQADDSISSRFGGTGLGLSLVKSLVDLHRGDVSVTSTPGVGTCFRVTLPIAQVAAAA